VIVWIALALALAALSVVGDLCESLLKRQAGRQRQRTPSSRTWRRPRSNRRAARRDAGGRAPGDRLPAMKRRIAILGATGSVGESTLDVIARHPGRFAVGAPYRAFAVGEAGAPVPVHRPQIAVLANPEAALKLERALAHECPGIHVLAGEAGLIEAATSSEIDTVVAAIVGAAGLRSTVAAAAAGKRILLANKEALVIGGAVFMRAVETGGATLLPIDSEHNAIFQCLPASYARNPAASGVRRIVLTASGGPFRTRPLAELPTVTADEACAHPNWVMGRKISVDSATMMNKGLEMIEGALAVRSAAGANRDRRPSGERHPFPGRIR
jgi:1-deoxy-D-xylulose 5-phosphate reductoisomerase